MKNIELFEIADLKKFEEYELKERKEKLEEQINNIDYVLKNKDKEKSCIEVANRLKDLMKANADSSYMCIEEFRDNTGPIMNYFVNNPENVKIDSDDNQYIKIEGFVFHTYYNINKTNCTVCDNEFSKYEQFTGYLLKSILDEKQGKITFPSKEIITENLRKDIELYYNELLKKTDLCFTKQGFDIGSHKVIHYEVPEYN